MFIVFDIGGTKTKWGLSKNLKEIDNFCQIDTFPCYKDFLDFLKRNNFFNLKIACFGFPGVFDKSKNKLIYCPNLKDYEFRNLKKDLEKILKCKIILENDANLAGIGEANFGEGKNYKIISYITFSTGIGGTKIVDRKIDENFFGFEPGHSLFLILYKKDILPFQVEELIGGSSLFKIFNKELDKVKDIYFWKDFSKIASLFLVNVSLYWSPEIIIIGGGLSKRINMKILEKNFNKFYPFNLKPQLRRSKLLDKVGIYGGLSLIKEHLINKRTF